MGNSNVVLKDFSGGIAVFLNAAFFKKQTKKENAPLVCYIKAGLMINAAQI